MKEMIKYIKKVIEENILVKAFVILGILIVLNAIVKFLN